MRLVRNVVIVIVIAVLLLFGGRWVYNKIAHRAPVLPAKTTAAPASTPVLPTAIPSTPVPPTPVPPTPVPVPVSSGCSSVPDYDRPIQPQIGHPSLYVETGVNPNAVCWSGKVKAGFVAIVGGYEVDGISDGVYKAIKGPTDIEVHVKDGFLAICVSEVAEQEFCFRLGQAFQYNWAHAHIEPLHGWNCFPSSVAATSVVTHERRPSGDRVNIRFEAGESVVGWEIVLDNGQRCSGGDCYVSNAPTGGSVTSGVVNPWDTEVPSSPNFPK